MQRKRKGEEEECVMENVDCFRKNNMEDALREKGGMINMGRG